MQKSKIDWGVGQLWTWNPVTGCKRGCSWCYASRIHTRFYDNPFSDVVFHPDRLEDPSMVKKPARIFVGSMSDIQYWQKVWIGLILAVARKCPQHTFMFLTKHVPAYYATDWPENSMQGLTVTGAEGDDFWISDLSEMVPRPFLSIEPLLGPLERPVPVNIEKVIVGAMTGPGAVAPKKEWIDSIVAHASSKQLFWKASIRKFL
jgi:protein gp37